MNSVKSGLEFARCLASGESGAEIIMKTADQLSDMGGLARLGILVDFSGERCKNLPLDSPEITPQNLMMQKAYDLAFSLIHEEIKFMAMWKSTFPCRLAALLGASYERIKAEMGAMKAVAAAWAQAQGRRQPFWQALCRRSNLSWTIVRECFELFAEEGWQFTENCRKQVERLRGPGELIRGGHWRRA